MRLDEDCYQDCGGGGACNDAEHRRLATKIDLILYRLSGTVERLSLDTLRAMAGALGSDPAVKDSW